MISTKSNGYLVRHFSASVLAIEQLRPSPGLSTVESRMNHVQIQDRPACTSALESGLQLWCDICDLHASYCEEGISVILCD